MSYDDYDPDYIGGQLLGQQATNKSIQNAYSTYGRSVVENVVEDGVADFFEWLAEYLEAPKPARKIIRNVAWGVTKFVGHWFGWW